MHWRGNDHHLLDLLFGFEADRLGDDFSVLDDQERGDAHDAERGSQLGFLVYIDFADLGSTLQFLRKLVDHGGDHAARAAPRGPEIN